MIGPLIIVAGLCGAISGISLWVSVSTKQLLAKFIESSKVAVTSVPSETPRLSGRTLSPAPDRPKVLSKDERRELIASRAFDPEYLERVDRIRKERSRMSSLISPDPEAQINLVAWRARQK